MRQHERADCGPACLLSVLRHWGGDASLPDVRDLAGTDTGGTTLLGLQSAAVELGLGARGVRTDLDSLSTELPAIVHLTLADGRTHYAVLCGVDGTHVRLGDPADGHVRMHRTRFEDLWRSRAALVLRPGPHLRRSSPPAWWRWVAPYLRAHVAWLGQSVFLGVLGTSSGLATAFGVQLLIDRFIPGRDVGMILWTGALLGGLMGASAAVGHLRRRLLLRVHRNIAVAMNRDLLTHLFRLPLRFFESRTTGDLTARFGDAVRVQQALLGLLGTAAMDGLVVAGSLLFLVVLAPSFAAVGAVAIPLHALLLVRATAPLATGQRRALEARTRVEAAWIDAFGGISDIRSFVAASAFRRGAGALFRRFQAGVEALGSVQARVFAMTELTGGALLLGTLVWGALLVVQDALRLGEFIAAYSVLAGMLPSAERLAGTWGAALEASVAAERLRDVLLARPEAAAVGTRAVPLVRELRLSNGRIERPAGRTLLREASVAVPIGAITGLTGPVGSGKSTLVRALARLIPLAAGDLTLNEVPVVAFDLFEYRRRVAVCTGSPRIFQGTLGENVRLGRGDPPRSGIVGRLAAGAVAHLLPRFPQGWNTLVGDGGRHLSDGERQLVGYLRSLWGAPEVILADDAVSAADEEIGELVLSGLGAYARDHAVLLVTHDGRALARTARTYRVTDGTVV